MKTKKDSQIVNYKRDKALAKTFLTVKVHLVNCYCHHISLPNI